NPEAGPGAAAVSSRAGPAWSPRRQNPPRPAASLVRAAVERRRATVRPPGPDGATDGGGPSGSRSCPRNPVAERRGSPMSNGQVHVEPRTRSLTGVQILGTGSYVPEHVVSNHDLLETHGFDPEWIVNRTGILERRFALPHQATSDLCTV